MEYFPNFFPLNLGLFDIWEKMVCSINSESTSYMIFLGIHMNFSKIKLLERTIVKFCLTRNSWVYFSKCLCPNYDILLILLTTILRICYRNTEVAVFWVNNFMSEYNTRVSNIVMGIGGNGVTASIHKNRWISNTIYETE